jgi:hypothetical protein
MSGSHDIIRAASRGCIPSHCTIVSLVEGVPDLFSVVARRLNSHMMLKVGMTEIRSAWLMDNGEDTLFVRCLDKITKLPTHSS